jgi:glyoxylase-like metal-dependent hydrolase (beta-lactamase superfamily II)
MKLIHHFSSIAFSNTYLFGPDGGGEAVLVDPGVMDISLLKLIESNKLYPRHVLLTHHHKSHSDGIRTLEKIYDFTVYCSGKLNSRSAPCRTVSDAEELLLGDFTVKVISVPGHSADSVAYLTGDHLFSGDILAAGRLGSTTTYQAKLMLIKGIEERILPLPGEILLFPGHGPPSILKAETAFNPVFNGAIAHSRFQQLQDRDDEEV